MPFQRRFQGGVKIVDRTQTGIPRPPNTGVAQTEEGVIVGSLDNGIIEPGTAVKVSFPGPKESLLDPAGHMSPRWYRFLSELYRRTGGPNDNVNFVGTLRNIAFSPDSLAITGVAPSVEIAHTRMMTVGSVTLTGVAPTVSVA